jgi:exodeoxyribonuclease-3
MAMDQKVYTWWSYRNKDWKKSNRGRRLDHIWVSQPLKKHLESHTIMAETRDWEQPSDHVPVIVKIAA